MNPRRTLRVTAVINGLSTADWRGILSRVSAFYAPIVDLQFTIQRVGLQPVYNATYAGLAPTAVVDYEWYDRFVTIPNLGKADVVVFVTPMPTIPATFLGFMSSANCGPWECTVFCASPTDHIYINSVDQGLSVEVMIEHEISHALYYMKGMTGTADRTHEHFLSGNPTAVLKDLFFAPLTAVEQWTELIRVLNGGLVALGIISKARSVVGDQQTPALPAPAPKPAPVTPPNPNEKIYDLAAKSLGKDIAKQENELGCAEAVSYLLHNAYGDFPLEILSTITLARLLRSHPKFTESGAADVVGRGNIIICITGEGSDPSDHGHVGIVGDHGIMSNDSATGLFKENYTIASWTASFTARGFRTHIFRRSLL